MSFLADRRVLSAEKHEYTSHCPSQEISHLKLLQCPTPNLFNVFHARTLYYTKKL
jgi:hypothetical protein